MKQYFENILILEKNITIMELDKTKNDIANILKEQNGKLAIAEFVGLKNLAYEIRGEKQGIYIINYIRVDNEENFKIANLEKYLKENNKIIKFLTVRVNEEDWFLNLE